MKSVLDDLMASAFKPTELVLLKSDGPLRKLKALSDYWNNKAKEATERRPASEAVDHDADPPISNHVNHHVGAVAQVNVVRRINTSERDARHNRLTTQATR